MVVPSQAPSRQAARRLLVVLALLLVLGAGWATTGSVGAAGPATAPSVPTARCGPGSLPETSIQGRVPKADYLSGRAAQGYRCNTAEVAHQGSSGGFKTLRYTDAQGDTCAFYDSTLLIGRDVVANLLSGDGQGVVVLDMSDPAHPRRTANLTTPAMLTPHESLLVNQPRGLLVAEMGTAATLPGILDVYDVKTDCRHPRRLSTTWSALFGHESGFAPDGRTFYASGTAAGFAAIDLSDPRHPRTLFQRLGVQYHGMRLSDDGRTLYAANLGTPGPTGITGGGLRIIDVSQIQDRVPHPKVPTLSTLTWHGVSIPQVAEPFTRAGHQYLFEVDEFVDLFTAKAVTDLKHSPVGAARIIDVDDPRHPVIVSDVRLAVHQPDVHAGEQMKDPGAAFPAQGYAAHYCGVPTRDNPKIAGCSMILSGLRLFDIRDVRHPREVAYFNQPVVRPTKPTFLGSGAYAMSQPAWDPAHDSVWYTDSNSGFYVVRLTNGVERLLR
ncbi:LVIVD repeat-containing protein [Nocardioides pocheonensis]|uniref:LVIVD repeat-containing protein n=1 Tax=Nocardioides pocheonensis TaxID=661485 RepID=A0A3N0GPX9_9ACTN|nr:hypothetical protein [Nocardioides pocheonensis]RNM14212.1 hypothetical protein EFL26_14925 [Nocardioides pocheonensis]